MIRIGVLGAGHLGKIHIKLLKEIDQFELVGFYDPDAEKTQQASAEFGITPHDSIEALIEKVDAVDIVTPTLSHYDCAVKAIKAGKHVFIEKPITNTQEEAGELLELVEEADVKAQVGHVERFNPAYLALNDVDLKPMFIETHRLAQFNPRGTDVAVVLDLMIHDIDIVLSMVKSNVKRISASGVAVVSETPDIANARLEFDNGCVANLTASRISIKNMRKTRLFQKDAYISIDFLEKQTEIIQLSDEPDANNPIPFEIDTGSGSKYIHFTKPEIEDVNAIKMELEEFGSSIQNESPIRVSVLDGTNALQVAYQILDKIEKNILA